MPYCIVSRVHAGQVQFAVKNEETDKTHGWTTKEKADAQMRLLRAIDHGFVPSKVGG
jgi:hypothetical protein